MTRRSVRAGRAKLRASRPLAAPAVFAALVGLAACTDAPQPTGPARPGKPNFIQVATGPVVTSTADPGDGTCDDAAVGDGCTLREAIAFASAGAAITFAPGVTGTITLTAGELRIDKSLTITGPGARSLAVSGNDAGRVFDVSRVGPVTLAGLTVTGGRVLGSLGGGIANSGTLTLTRCTVTGNTAIDGGGIDNEGSLTVVESTISGNHALHLGGGIISDVNSDLSTPSTTILNSTISGNTADESGGGVTNYDGLTRILYSTITANRSPDGGGLWSFGDGGTRTDVESSIVAGNTTDGIAPNDVASSQTTTRYRSLGYNVVGQAGANVDFALEFNQTGDQTSVIDPAKLQLGVLANNGGPTNTHAVLTGSAAFDKGNPAFDPNAFTPPLATDQRGTGFARVSGGGIDVGAFERQVTLFPFTGFLQPVDNPGANDDMVNRAKAGTAIPIKFTLGGNQGLAIFRSGYPRFVSEPCVATDKQDDIEATTTSPAGLTYDSATQQYTYVWKTDKGLAGRCGELELGLTDGSNHHALFSFVR